MSTQQIDLAGLHVQLDRRVDRKKPCHGNRGVVTEGVGSTYALRCAVCGRRRGWLAKAAAEFLVTAIKVFGPSPRPFVIRNSRQPVKQAQQTTSAAVTALKNFAIQSTKFLREQE